MSLLEQHNHLLVNHLPPANPSSNTYNGKGTLLVNEFGNGFVNLLHSFPSQLNQSNQTTQTNQLITVYIPKSQLSRAFHLEPVEIEYTYSPQTDTYSGRVVNYSLLGRKFVGLVHHIYKTNVYIYIPELKLSNLVQIETPVYLDKQTWVQIQITQDQPNSPLHGELLTVIPITSTASVNDIIALKYSLGALLPESHNNAALLPESHNNAALLPESHNNAALLPESHNNAAYPEIDQTHLETFTIDPPGSLDCDDAFSVELDSRNPNQARIYVHIANVAYYFNPTDTHPAIWQAITQRATTFYGTNGINWPMLPPEYANEKCSILPAEYKTEPSHVLTCEFMYSRTTATIQFIKWYPAIVVSKAKYDYETVDNILALKTHQTINILLESATILRRQYNDFTFGMETPAHWLVRYWMIYVNQVMCQGIYRYNPIPDDGKKDILVRYIYHIFNNSPSQMQMQSAHSKNHQLIHHRLLDREDIMSIINAVPTDPILQYLGKVAMAKSYYSACPNDNYHYGIGVYGYTHWTSPIRRLPDLLNHLQLLGYSIPPATLTEYLDASNAAEIKQDGIERFIIMWNNANKYKIGDILEGVIINVFKTGVSVYVPELENRYTIHISKLSSRRLEFNPLEYSLKSIDNDVSNSHVCVVKLFQQIRLKISKIFFDILEFDVVMISNNSRFE
jgi:ribonuclease R